MGESSYIALTASSKILKETAPTDIVREVNPFTIFATNSVYLPGEETASSS